VDSVRDEVRAPLGAHVALALAQIGFGLHPVASKKVFPPLGPLTPLSLAALRAAFGALSLFLFAELVKSPRVERRRDLAWLAVNAVFGIILNQTLYLEGLHHSSATHAGLLVAATPALAYLFAILARRERAALQPALGVLLAILGAGWIALVRHQAPGNPATLFGDSLLISNVASYAVYLVMVRDVLQRVDPIRAIAWIFVFGAVANVPLGVPDLLSVPWSAMTPTSWAWLAFILLFPTSICYALNAFALRRAPSTLAAIYTTSQPIVSTVAAMLILDERSSPRDTVLAAFLIVTGVTLVAFRRLRSSP